MFSNYKLKKLFVILVIFSILISALDVVIEELFFGDEAESIALDSALKQSKERASILHHFVEHAEDDLTFLRNSPQFINYLENQEYMIPLTDLFLSYATHHKQFMQLRYIDANGHEQIRVEREHIQSDPLTVPANRLEDKSSRYYYTVSKTKTVEEPWFSALDLNVRNGRIETPYKPTLRAVLPVSKNGKFDGLLIINYFMKPFLKHLASLPLYDMILFNNKGETLYHYEHEKSWGHYKEKPFNISDEFQDSYHEILSQPVLKSESFVSVKIDTPIYNGINLIMQLKQSYKEKLRQQTHYHYLLAGLLVMIISIAFAMSIIKFFSNSLFDLEKIRTLNNAINEASKIAKIGFWQFDARSGTIEWSDGVYDIFELEKQNEKITYQRFLSFIPVEERKQVGNAFESSIREQKEYFITHLIETENQNRKYLQERAIHYYDDDGNHIKSIGSVYDITERYLSELKYKTILQLAFDGIHILDMQGNIVEFSQSFANSLEYSREEMKQLNVRDWDVNFSDQELAEVIPKIMRGEEVFYTKHKTKSGKILDVQIYAKGIQLNDALYLYASSRDVTDSKRQEAKIIDQNQELQQLNSTLHQLKLRNDLALEVSQIGIWEWDFATDAVSWDERMYHIYDIEKEKAQIPFKLWHDSVEKSVIAEVEQQLQHARKNNETFDISFWIVTPKGEKRFIKAFGINQYDENGKAVKMIGTNQNITELKNQENALREKDALLIRQSRTAALGEMLNMIAHQWRQPINAISAAAIGVGMKVKLDDLDNEALLNQMQFIQDQCQKMSGTINDFMNFSNPNQENQHFFLKESMDTIFKMIKAQFDSRGIKLNVGEIGDIQIHGVKNEMDHILINLLSNARDAFEEKGILDQQITINAFREDHSITIEIEDNAGGIPDQIMEKLFDPYFTTKEEGKGSGIGLYMTKQIIEKHFDGTITANNKGQGACFTVKLPIMQNN